MTTAANTPEKAIMTVSKGGIGTFTPQEVIVRDAPANSTDKQSDTGSKYDSSLTVKEIAKLIRKELAEKFPTKAGWKFSVTAPRHSYLSVVIMSVPEDVFIYSADHYEETVQFDGCYSDAIRKTPEWETTYKAISAIRDQYNYDRSDTMTDYFDVNFYGDVNVDYDIRQYYIEAFKLLYGELKF